MDYIFSIDEKKIIEVYSNYKFHEILPECVEEYRHLTPKKILEKIYNFDEAFIEKHNLNANNYNKKTSSNDRPILTKDEIKKYQEHLNSNLQKELNSENLSFWRSIGFDLLSYMMQILLNKFDYLKVKSPKNFLLTIYKYYRHIRDNPYDYRFTLSFFETLCLTKPNRLTDNTILLPNAHIKTYSIKEIEKQYTHEFKFYIHDIQYIIFREKNNLIVDGNNIEEALHNEKTKLFRYYDIENKKVDKKSFKGYFNKDEFLKID